MLSQISDNTKTLGYAFERDANSIAPLDSGKLRNSSTIKNSQFAFTVIWDLPYANRRYYENKKNPGTKKWAQKAVNRNKSRYMEIIKKGVVK